MPGLSRPKDGVLSHAYGRASTLSCWNVLHSVMAGLGPIIPLALSTVMPALVAAIHVFAVARPQDVDARHKAGHDGGETVRKRNSSSSVRNSAQPHGRA